MQAARCKWYHIGLELKISANDLDAIKKEYNDPEDTLTETLKIFLKKVNPKPTWAQLADALGTKSVGYGYLVESVRHRGTHTMS
jgi:hypothetical protein